MSWCLSNRQQKSGLIYRSGRIGYPLSIHCILYGDVTRETIRQSMRNTRLCFEITDATKELFLIDFPPRIRQHILSVTAKVVGSDSDILE